MKANELMLGDWVTYNGVPSQVTMTSAEGVVMVLKEGKVVFTNSELLNPIPLTDEILIANGWELIWDFTDYKYYRHRKMKSNVKCKKNPGIYVLRTIHFRCVHEFQHLLRLCGEEDLANNLL